MDVVWDCYEINSLKSQTRQKQEMGTRTRVDGKNKIPTNWTGFLRVDDNTTELFHFLARNLVEMLTAKQVVSTCGPNVLSSHPQETDKIVPCTHEEADTRMLLHAADAAREGFKKITLWTVDTDVVVLAIAHVSELDIEELWVAFGTGKNF